MGLWKWIMRRIWGRRRIKWIFELLNERFLCYLKVFDVFWKLKGWLKFLRETQRTLEEVDWKNDRKNELKPWKSFFCIPFRSIYLEINQKINEHFLVSFPYHKNLIFITKLIDFSKIYFVLKLQKKLKIQQRNLLRAIISIFQKISPKRSIFEDFLSNIKNSTDSYPPCIITFPSHLWLFIGPFFLHKYVFHSLNILIILVWLRNFWLFFGVFLLRKIFLVLQIGRQARKHIFLILCVKLSYLCLQRVFKFLLLI